MSKEALSADQKNWTIWQCIEHGRMFAAHAGCSYCREGRAPIRSELKADSPDIHFDAVLREYERGEPISASDLINALRWRIENQRNALRQKSEQIERLQMTVQNLVRGTHE
jgi:hypothetical protein